MATKKIQAEKDVRVLITDHLIEIERDLAWLSRKTGIVYATLYSCLVQKHFNISDDNLVTINQTLGTDFKKENL